MNCNWGRREITTVRMISKNQENRNITYPKLNSNHHRNLLSRRRYDQGQNSWIMNSRMMDLSTEVYDGQSSALSYTHGQSTSFHRHHQLAVAIPNAPAIQVNNEVSPVPQVM
jgi:hypothetical protein